jgi:hypothetical protein
MIARQRAQAVAADPDALAAWDIGLTDLPPDVDAELRALLARTRRVRDWIDADCVHLIGADDDR